MMCWWAENQNGVEFKRHLARVPDYLWLGEDGMKMQTFGSQLWDSALATQAIILSDMPEEYGDSLRKANFYIKESQIKNNPRGDFSKMGRQISKGAWTFTDQDHGWAVSDCTAEALKVIPYHNLCLYFISVAKKISFLLQRHILQCLLLLSQMPDEVTGEKVDKERLFEAVNFLLYVQSSTSGGFAIWERPVPQPYLEVHINKQHFSSYRSLI